MNLHILRSREMALISDFLDALYTPVTAEEFGGHLVEIATRLCGDFAHTNVYDEADKATGAYRSWCNRGAELAPYVPALAAKIHQNPSWAYGAAGGGDGC